MSKNGQPTDETDIWGEQPKRSITEIINDPEISDEEKYQLTMAHNVCLSEYCHIIRESLSSIVAACNRHIQHLARSPIAPPSSEMQQMFFDIGAAASAAGTAKAPTPEQRDANGVPITSAGPVVLSGKTPIHTKN